MPESLYLFHALDFFVCRMAAQKARLVPFMVSVAGGPLAVTLSSSKVPQGSARSFPGPVQSLAMILADSFSLEAAAPSMAAASHFSSQMPSRS